ncbi:MAG TPA: hypothetical protein DEV93_14490 [Chloroflexi bacterium]|jgi:hypothetical protein|nr:hypothetical protein [Chloroflexota bacterium]
MIEERLTDELNRLFPRTTAQPDWLDVRQRAGHGGRRKTRWVGVAAAVGALAVGVLGLWPSRSSFTDQALAAIGRGRWIEVEVSTAAPTLVIDIATRRSRAVPSKTAVAYDSEEQLGYSWTPGRRDVVAGTGPEPALAGFISGYRAALAQGSSYIVGHVTVRQHVATLLRFRQGAQMYQEVAVDDRTHRPLWFRMVTTTGPGRRFNVLRIATTAFKPKIPRPLPASAYISGKETTLKSVHRSAIAAGVGGTAVWLGDEFHGLTLRAAEIDRVTKVRLRGFVPLAHGRGAELRYGGAGGWLDISEETRPYAYEFFAYPGRPVTGFDAVTPIPEVGQFLLSCSTCGGGSAPQFHPIWEAQMRAHGLFVRIRSWSRTRVIAAAEHLRLLLSSTP